MNTQSQPADEPEPGKPGKLRTWWHPLLASLLRWQLGSHYQLQEEVPVGQKPLQIDILLLRKQQGELSKEVQRMLAGLAEYLNDFTLLELKSPSDTLRAGDFQTFLAYTLLYRAQNEPLLALDKVHLLVLAPSLTKPYAEELRTLGVTPRQEKLGIWALEGGVVIHRTWLLETGMLAGLDHPLLTLFSPQFLKEGPKPYAQLRQGGYSDLIVYAAQQIQQFRLSGMEFAMQHLGTEVEMEQALLDIFASLPPEMRLAGLDLNDLVASLPPEQRLQGLPPEQRLQGLAPEQRLQGLTPDELEQLRKLLQKHADKDAPPA